MKVLPNILTLNVILNKTLVKIIIKYFTCFISQYIKSVNQDKWSLKQN